MISISILCFTLLSLRSPGRVRHSHGPSGYYFMCVVSHFSHVPCFATPWTTALQTPLSMGFPRQEYWSGLSFPSPGDLPEPGIEPVSLGSPVLQEDSLPLSHLGNPIIS